VDLGRLVEPEGIVALGDDARATDDGVIDHDGVGQHEDAEVGAVVGAGHRIEGRRDVVDGIAGGELCSAKGQDEVLERDCLGTLPLTGSRCPGITAA
jgi:hypothetical protein